jgi:hypothetical protein
MSTLAHRCVCASTLTFALLACGGSSGTPLFGAVDDDAGAARDAGGPPDSSTDAGVANVPDAPAPAACDADPAVDPRVLDDACGIFVAPFALGGDDAAPGTRAQPAATLGRALTLARSQRLPRVYACNAIYEEALVLGVEVDGVSLVGGITCPTAPEHHEGAWAYRPGTRATLRAPAGNASIPLDVRGHARETLIQDFEIVANDAAEPGASSVSVRLVGSAPVTFRRSKIVAGRGRAGADGFAGHAAMGTIKSVGRPADGLNGGVRGEVTCWNGDKSFGGEGGSVTNRFAAAGTSGQPALTPGGNASLADACAATHAPAGPGMDGAPGANAKGGASGGLFSAANAWSPAAGTSGVDGRAGEGGGGGAAAWSDTTDLGKNVGPGGGGGGAIGGCGGGGGAGGGGGGASIAVVAVGTHVAIVASELTTSAAGAGGRGAVGVPGDTGVAGHPGYLSGCSGGDGGHGGAGGAGAGGAGGVSVAVVTTDRTAAQIDSTKSSLGNAGAGGTGGAPGTNDGEAGIMKLVLEVSRP